MPYQDTGPKMITDQCTSVRRAMKKCAWRLQGECVHSTTRCFRSSRSTCVGVSTPLDSWAVFVQVYGQSRTRSTWREEDKLNKVGDDIHVIVIGKRSWKLRRCLNFSVQCFRPAKRWDFMHKSRVISVACHSHDAWAAQCAQRLSSSQGETHHRVSGPSRKCHWGRWCSCTRERRAGVAYDVCVLWNMTSVLLTRLNTASPPTCSLARKEAHLRHNSGAANAQQAGALASFTLFHTDISMICFLPV